MLMRTFFGGNIYVACISRNFGVVAKESIVLNTRLQILNAVLYHTKSVAQSDPKQRLTTSVVSN